MRSMSPIALALLGMVSTCGCAAPSIGEAPPSDQPLLAPTEPSRPSTSASSASNRAGRSQPSAPEKRLQDAPLPIDEAAPAPPPAIDPSPATHPEVVYLLMTMRNGYGFCTGTLIAKDVVVTAAHCLQSMFTSWTVIAPSAPNQPRVEAARVLMFDRGWAEPGHPDIGIVKLSAPIALPAYAELTDVSAAVDAGTATSVAAVVRTEEEPEAPLHKTNAMPLSSTVELGYTHGFGVPLFSAGGDSGAGLFLVEGGKMTHKLVAVEREPEPSRRIDHLTRVETTFVQWVAQNGG